MSLAPFSDLVTSFHSCGDEPAMYPPWRELIKDYRPQERADSGWGEIRRREDLKLLPREVHHRHLDRGDGGGRSMCGWLKLDADGEPDAR